LGAIQGIELSCLIRVRARSTEHIRPFPDL
jgi:hypothetical protein